MKSLKDLLNQTYPRFDWEKTTTMLLDSMVWGFVVFILLSFFRPFGLVLYPGNIWLASLPFAVMTVVVSFVFDLLMRHVGRQLSRWKVWHEALSMFLLIFFIAIGCSLTYVVVFHSSLSWSVIVTFMYYCLLVDIIIIPLAMLINYNRKLRHQIDITHRKTPAEQEPVSIQLHNTAVRGQDLTLLLDDFIYAEVQKNYVTVHYLKDGQKAETQLRTTLSNLKEELPFDCVVQCHRSFLVNMNNIISARGNSNGYILEMSHGAGQVPVSRGYVPVLKGLSA